MLGARVGSAKFDQLGARCCSMSCGMLGKMPGRPFADLPGDPTGAVVVNAKSLNDVSMGQMVEDRVSVLCCLSVGQSLTNPRPPKHSNA